MDTDKIVLLRAFNKQFFDFLDDLLGIYPNNVEILTAKSMFETIKGLNPTSIIKVWYLHVGVPYKTQIEAENISFFVEKDYSVDLQKNQVANASNILNMIENIRDPIKRMDSKNMAHSAKHIRNLSKLSEAYASLQL